MTSTLMDLGIAAQENTLSAMETSKAYMLESFKAMTATTRRVMPTMPAMPELTPLIDPREAVAMSYDFAEKVMASQRSFVEEMMASLAPAED